MKKNRPFTRILFAFLLASIFCLQYGNAQQLTKKHKVKRGETVYQISRMYNVSPQDIIALNPNAAKVIYPNEYLILPSENDTNESSNQDNSVSNTNIIKHQVIRGETKYGLSKKYGISIAELERQNPHIKSMLQAGHNLTISSLKTDNTSTNGHTLSHFVKKGETLYGLSKKYNVSVQEIKSANPQLGILKYDTTISIPAAELELIAKNKKHNTENEPENTLDEETTEIISKENNSSIVTNDKDDDKIENEVIEYEDYTVKPKETLYGLSKQAGMAIPEFLKLNPELKNSVQVGTTIKMPKKISQNTVDNGFAETQDTKKINSDYENLQLTIDKSIRPRILFVLPFTEKEFTDINLAPQGINKMINEDKKKQFAYYQGAKLAIDSLKKLGVIVKTDVIKIDNITGVSRASFNAMNTPLESYRSVFVPFYGNNMDWFSSLSLNKKIPVVTSYDSPENIALTNIIEAYPTIESQKLKMLNYIKNKNARVIVVSDYERGDSKEFILKHIPDASIITTRKNGNFSSSELSSLLEKSNTNFVIIDSDRNGVFLNTTNTLLREVSNYNIQLAVLESSLIPSEDQISSKRFTILKMLHPEIIHIAENKALPTYTKGYISAYGKELSNYIMEGFDITFDTLLRISQKDGLVQNVPRSKTAYSYLKFEYHKNKSGRYVNDIVQVREFNMDDMENATN